MADAGTIRVKLTGDMTGFNTAIKRMRKDVSGAVGPVRRDLGKIGSQLKTIGKYAGITALAVGGVSAKLIDVASDAQETQNMFDVVFRGMAKEANNWAVDFGESVGRSRTDVKKWMASLQDTFVPLGFARTESMKFSQTLTRLAVDVASFKNMADRKVIEDFTSAIVGNHETVKKYGVIINETTILQEALRSGMIRSKKEMTEEIKVRARLNLLMRSTTDAQGDALRTSGSFANQLKRLKGNIKNTAEELGKNLIPYATEVVTKINQWVKNNQELIKTKLPEYVKKIVEKIKDLAGYVIKHKDMIGKILVVTTIATVTTKIASLATSIGSLVLNLGKLAKFTGILKMLGSIGGAAATVTGGVAGYAALQGVNRFEKSGKMYEGGWSQNAKFGGIPTKQKYGGLTGAFPMAGGGFDQRVIEYSEKLKGFIAVSMQTGRVFKMIEENGKKIWVPHIEAMGRVKQKAIEVTESVKKVGGKVSGTAEYKPVGDTGVSGGIRGQARGGADNKFEKRAEKEATEYTSAWAEGYTRLESLAENFSVRISSAFQEAALSSRGAFEVIADSFKNMLLSMAAEITAKAVVFKALNFLTGGQLGIDTGGFSKFIFGGLGFAGGGMVPRFAGGGMVDSVPAMLTPGEVVVKKPVVDQYGPANVTSFGQTGDVSGMGSTTINMNIQTTDPVSFERWAKTDGRRSIENVLHDIERRSR